MDAETPQYPINFVARRTGLSTHVIRVWERRHQAVTPGRSDTKRRLYSDAEVERLRLLATLTQAGHTISQVAGLSTEELRRQVRGLRGESLGAESGTAPSKRVEVCAELLEVCRTATLALDRPAMEAALHEARLLLPPLIVLEDLVVPLMVWVGDAWHAGHLRVAQEHFASAVVREFLLRLQAGMTIGPHARVIAVATPSGEQHEIGALLVAVTAALEGWRILYLGANLPAAELARAAVDAGARYIALSVAVPAGLQMADELEDLRRLVPAEIGILAGGGGLKRIARQLEERDIRHVASLEALQAVLREELQ